MLAGELSVVSPRTPSSCTPGCTAAGCVPACRWSKAGVSGPWHRRGSPRAPDPHAVTAAAGSATCPTAAWPPPQPGSCSGGAEEREGRGYSGKAKQGGGEQQDTQGKATLVLQELMQVHPEEHGMRSLLLRTLPMVSVQDSSTRNGSKSRGL